MSRYMNDYDIQHARARFTRSSTPNRLALAIMVDNLATWANQRSDGWAYWQAPRKAAARAVDAIYSTTNAANDEQERNDITDDDMAAAARPVKAFLTRHKASAAEREHILRSVTS